MDSNAHSAPFWPAALFLGLTALQFVSGGDPWVDLRPEADTRIPKIENARVRSHAWDDPLPAIRAFVEATRTAGARRVRRNSLERVDRALCVMLRSGDSGEASEFRLRTRYAVHAACASEFLQPVDPDWLDLAASGEVGWAFEVFQSTKKDRPSRLIVGWFEESGLPDHNPVPLMRKALQELVPGDRLGGRVAIIGPAFSDRLAAFGRSAAGLRIYSPWATAAVGEDPKGLERTIVDDRTVARALCAELRRRGIGPSEPILLVAERDVLFTREWAKLIKAEFAAAETAYFARGLDGARATAEGSQRGGDEPVGPSKLDHLRRLQTRLLGQGKMFHAVGIFATDVYDKTMILRALRPVIPGAVFFTNDIDARFAHPKLWRWTRNLIVGAGARLTVTSSGRNLPVSGEALMPPFRGGYQASTYRAVRAAIQGLTPSPGKAASERATSGSVPSPLATPDASVGTTDTAPPTDPGAVVKAGTGEPAIYEIGRGVAWELDAQPSPWGRQLLLFAILVGVAGVLVLGFSLRRREVSQLFRLPPAEEGRPRWRRVLGAWQLYVFVLGPATLFSLIVVDATRHGGEPFTLLRGISVWPTEILRYLAIILSVVFGVICLRRMQDCEDRLEQEFGLAAAPPSRSHGRWREALGLGRPADDDEAKDLLGRLDLLWRRYRWRHSFARRRNRALALALGSSAVALLVILWFGLPNRPYRGGIAGSVDFVVLVLGVVSMLWLLFVAGGTCHGVGRLIAKVVADPEDWPTAGLLSRKMNRDRPEIGAYEKFRFVRAIADEASSLVYFPFIAILLIAVSRNRYFDNWHWPLELIVLLCGALVLLIMLSLSLSSEAREARRQTEDALVAARMRVAEERLMGAEAVSRFAHIDRMLRDVAEQNQGAFAPLSNHPILRAILIPTGGLGGLTAIDLLTRASGS